MERSDASASLVTWVPAPYEIVRQMLVLAGTSPGDVVYDLGCGDGRVLISAVNEFGARAAVGYELRQDLCEKARTGIAQCGLSGKIRIVVGDLREADLSGASVVTLYLTTEANELLRDRLARGLRPGSRVVTYLFPIPGWVPTKELDLGKLSFEEGQFVGKLYSYFVQQARS
jgi:ubiquinone/menaquinone biosynthesis C-methylase UbiE